ncbi:MAG TPA: hypothetical protein VK139_05630, partial [Microbacteriaceae bacterium]|nr:hypothetical protein [Microbacteriaceae bacterium]
ALDRALAVTTAQWPGDMASVSGVLALAQGVGLPPATILRAEARALRDEAGTRARTRVSELTVKLTLPIGACVLPTFIVWGVVPVILSTFHSLTHS